MNRSLRLLLVAVVGSTLAACSGGKPPAAAGADGVAKGKFGEYYYVNLFWPPVGGTISSSESPAPRINCGAASRGTPKPDQDGVLQYDWQYYPGANRCGQVRYAWNETVELTVTPGPGYLFHGWAGDCSGVGTCSLTAGADKTVVAIFSTGSTWVLSVARTGTGTGTVTADILGQPTVTCSPGTASCTFVVPATTPATEVTLGAQAAAGSHFTSWGGACAGPGVCVVSADQDLAATAAFNLDAGGGTVVDSSGGNVLTTTPVVLQIPPGAIDNPTTFSVTVAVSPPPLPPQVPPSTTVYQFEPAGQVFTTPVTVRLPVPGGVTNACIWWSQQYAAAYECIGGTVSNGFIETQVSHFSEGFVAEAPAVQTVIGSRINSHILSGGNLMSSPDQLELDTVAAWVPDGAGGFSRFAGTGDPSGVFSISGLPIGSTPTFQVGPGSKSVFRLASTAETSLDFGELLDGRPGLTPVAAADPMPMNLNVSLVEPYAPLSEIDVFSVGANSWGLYAEGAGLPFGSTSFTLHDLKQARFPSAIMNVVDGARDSILVQQLGGVSSNGFSYRQVRGLGVVHGLTVNPAVPPQPFGVVIQPQPQGGQVTLDWNTPAYQAALVGTGGPPCSPTTPNFYVSSQPGASTVGLTGGQTRRTMLQLWAWAPGPSGVSTGLMTFGANPDPAYAQSFGLHWNAIVNCNASMLAPNGSALGVGTSASAFGLYSAPLTAVSLLAPEVSPPQNVRVNGLPLAAPLPDVADGPVISWDPPAIGTPDVYRIILRHLVNGTNQLETLAVMATTTTSLAIPPGLLKKGESYMMLVQSAKGGTKASRPGRFYFPTMRAAQNTPWFTISPNLHHVGGTFPTPPGAGLVLSMTGAPDLSVAPGAAGFIFGGPVVTGGQYTVSVSAQPTNPPQVCTVVNPTVTVGAGDVTDVVVSCL